MRIIKSEREYVHDASSISFYEKKIKSDDEKKIKCAKIHDQTEHSNRNRLIHHKLKIWKNLGTMS